MHLEPLIIVYRFYIIKRYKHSSLGESELCVRTVDLKMNLNSEKEGEKEDNACGIHCWYLEKFPHWKTTQYLIVSCLKHSHFGTRCWKNWNEPDRLLCPFHFTWLQLLLWSVKNLRRPLLNQDYTPGYRQRWHATLNAIFRIKALFAFYRFTIFLKNWILSLNIIIVVLFPFKIKIHFLEKKTFLETKNKF